MAILVELQSAKGGVDGTPATLTPVTAVRFHGHDLDLVDETDTLYRPTLGPIFTYEKWLRVVWVSGTGTLSSLRLGRSGGRVAGVSEWMGERSQAQGYQIPSQTNRYAVDLVPDSYTFTHDPGPYSLSGQQIGPWIVLQWAIAPGAQIGPTEGIVYTLEVDES